MEHLTLQLIQDIERYCGALEKWALFRDLGTSNHLYFRRRLLARGKAGPITEIVYFEPQLTIALDILRKHAFVLTNKEIQREGEALALRIKRFKQKISPELFQFERITAPLHASFTVGLCITPKRLILQILDGVLKLPEAIETMRTELKAAKIFFVDEGQKVAQALVDLDILEIELVLSEEPQNYACTEPRTLVALGTLG